MTAADLLRQLEATRNTDQAKRLQRLLGGAR